MEDRVIDFQASRGGFSLGLVAPRTEISEYEFEVSGTKTKVAYYRNRITLESDAGAVEEILKMFPEEENESLSDAAKRNDASQYKAAKDLCDLVVRWDWTGELRNRRDEVVVADGEPIPLNPDIVRLIPIRLTQELQSAIVRRELGGNENVRPRR